MQYRKQLQGSVERGRQTHAINCTRRRLPALVCPSYIQIVCNNNLNYLNSSICLFELCSNHEVICISTTHFLFGKEFKEVKMFKDAHSNGIWS